VKQLLVVTGLSGAGRSTSAAVLDDLGWYVIDNLPAALLPQITELASSKYDQIALVVAGFDDEMAAEIQNLRSRIPKVRMVFLEASVDVLVQRFDLTKRRHPLPDGGLMEAILSEVTIMSTAKSMADLVIDTTELNPHQLRERLSLEFGSSDHAEEMSVTVSSFGFKHGVPLDVDLVFDVRFLPNPYWVEGLRPFSGKDVVIQDYVLEREGTQRFLDRLMDLLIELLPSYEREGRSYLNIAFGCTGGRHRSVAVAETVAAALKEESWLPRVTHRDIDR
jgi:RNase adapter protein RapZ